MPTDQDYVCVQCGPDPRGPAVHAEQVHTFPGLQPDPEPTGEQVNTYTVPDLQARRDVRHAVLASALRNMGRRAPADRIWGRFYGQGPEIGAKGNVWAGDPEDVADNLIRALWAAEGGH